MGSLGGRGCAPQDIISAVFLPLDQEGSFEVITVMGRLLEVKQLDPAAGKAGGKSRTIHKDSARLAVLDLKQTAKTANQGTAGLEEFWTWESGLGRAP